MFKTWSLRKKLIWGSCLSGLLPMLIVAIFAINRSSEALKDQAFTQLSVTRDLVTTKLQDKFDSMSKQVRYYSTQESMKSLFNLANQSFKDHAEEASQQTNLSYEEVKKKLWGYYSKNFNEEYKSRNKGKENKDLEALFNSLDKESVYAQYDFIINNPNALGEKDRLYESSISTKYGDVHNKIHKDLRNLLQEFGFYDVFLVEAKTGRVVYSVFKEIDYGTSLKTGPFKDTGLGLAFQKAASATEMKSFVTDLDFYFPSYDFPASFISAPIIEKGQTIGAFIIQVPVDIIDKITTNNKAWSSRTYGHSGEVYIVGKDKMMRSLSRGFAENKVSFLEQYIKLGGERASADQMEVKEMTTLLQKVDTEAVNLAIASGEGEKIVKDYRGEPVFSSYSKLNIEGLDWYVFSEKDEAEILENIGRTVNALYLIGAIAMILLAFAGTSFSKTISKALATIASGIDENAIENKKASGLLGTRAVELSASTNEQSAATQETMAAMTEISGMLRSTNEKTSATNTLIDEINEKVDGGMRLINHLTEAMDSILESTKNLAEFESIISNIEDKTKVINDIVFKTQLLSFNASIEAARAGQHGRGFAVVAEEVGNLADLSGKAALEITGLLGHSTGKVKDLVHSNARSVETGKETTEKVTDFFNEISKALSVMTTNITAIDSATKEQETGVIEVGTAIKQLEASTISNSAVAEDVNKMASNAEKLVLKMNYLVGQLNELVDGAKGSNSARHFSAPVASLSTSQSLDSVDDDSVDYDSFKRVS